MGCSPFASPLPLFPSLLRCFVLFLTNFLSCDSIAFQTGLVRCQLQLDLNDLCHLIFFDHLCVAYKGKTCRPASCVSFAFHEAEKESLAFPWEIFVAFATCCNSSCSGLVSLSALCSLADCALLWPKQEPAGCATNCCRKSDLCVVKVVALS